MKSISGTLVFVIICTLFTNCNNSSEKNKMAAAKDAISKKDWGEVDGKKIYLYTLENNNGTTMTITNYGGTVTSFVTQDKNGNKSSIIIGFDSLQPYLQHPPYFGALIGRYGNRIGNAKFTLDGTTYKLAANDGKNHLHGGLKGFDKVVWDATIPNDSVPSLTLKYLSKDGEEGYPGNLNVTVQYTLNNDDGLEIEYNAETDKATPVNLTNHSYFNLTGDVSNTILNHTLMIDADHYTPVDTTLIPTGEIKPVKGTPFDFTTAKKIGQDIDAVKGGYDHNWVLNKKDTSLQKVAELSDSISGRTLEVYTTQPGLQFYTGNFLDGKFVNRGGKPLQVHTALCLETQHFPDSPNKPNFPTTILKPGEKYHAVTIYKVKLNKS
ncbi:galactose mutarotase [Ginsengibacter hankyongi]|uniref:Aldose 1-epimerase n=1 Tax=Ginsengibacter hankyongi TaxID=2607284 RepID=A0A5J5IIP8_9BACT|nr:aldose epimerase family protein [Ginsengibacter hankyongi]KAA9040915.1 galactose mutarotase [Ginsengibacter hankyongi]